MRTRLQYLVSIQTKTTLTDSTIGCTNGLIVLTDSEYAPVPTAKRGILSTEWITPYGGSANTTQSGDIAQYTQWDIKLTSKPNILNRIDGLIGCTITVHIYDGTVIREVRGIISNTIDSQTEVILTCSPVSKFRECPVGVTVLGSGLIDLQEVSEDDIILEIDGATAGFYATFLGTSNIYGEVNLCSIRVDYAYPNSILQVQLYLAQKQAEGCTFSIGKFAVTINAIIGHTALGTTTGILLKCSFKNIGDTRILEENGVIVLTISKKKFIADATSGAISLPQQAYSDGLTINDSAVIISGDPIVFNRITPQSFSLVTPSKKPNWLYPTINSTDFVTGGYGFWTNGTGGGPYLQDYYSDGAITDIFDNLYGTLYKTSATATSDSGSEILHIVRVSFPPMKQKPKNLFLSMVIKAQATGIGNDITNFKPTFWIDYKYGREYVQYDTASMTRSAWEIDNDIPTLLDKPIDAERSFRWGDTNTSPSDYSGIKLEIGQYITEDYMLQAGIDVYICLYAGMTGFPITGLNLDYRYHSFSLVSEEPLDTKSITYNAQASGNYTYNSYLKALKLQNWADVGWTPPPLGWGKGFPVESAELYNYAQLDYQYGGIESIDTTIFGQFSDGDTTADIKQDICRAVFGLGTVDSLGIEHLFKISDGLHHSEGTIYTISDIVDGKRYGVNPYPIEQLWTGIDLEWGNDGKKITITNTEQEGYSSSYVTGITSGATASILWDRFRYVYDSVHQKAICKKTVKLLDSEESAIAYINGLLNLIGCYEFTVFSRYKLTFQTSFYRGIDIELGDRMGFSYPATGFVHRGFIESVTKDPIRGTCSIVAQMVGYEIGGYSLIIEGVTGADTIIEGFTGVDTIKEGV